MNPTEFVKNNTQLVAPPLVPEIKLHLATEVVPLWRLTEEELEAQGVPPPYWAFAWAGGPGAGALCARPSGAGARARRARFRRGLGPRRHRGGEGGGGARDGGRYRRLR